MKLRDEERYLWEELRRRVGANVIKKYEETFKNEEITKEAQLRATVPSVLRMLMYNSGPQIFEASALST